MKKIRAVVSGTVQNVGYRAKVITIAKVLGLTGFVQNLDDGRVRIIAESEDGDLDRFINAIRIKNTLIDVDAVEVEYADATGDFEDFYKLVGGGEADERLDKAAEYLKKLIDVSESGFAGMRSDMQEMRAEIREVRTAVGECGRSLVRCGQRLGECGRSLRECGRSLEGCGPR